MKDCPLDRSVEGTLAELAQHGIAAPRALFLLGTGPGLLPQKLRGGGVLPLAGLKSVPRPWRELELFHGELAGAPVWILEDAPGPPELGNTLPADEPAWVAGWPCWLAASAGASLCVHSSAGPALPGTQPGGPEPGMIALVRDHINLSGRTPLVGLSESRLGPLFPDQSRLHHHELRKQALAAARKLGLPCCEAVVACVAGPTLETPAERRYWAHAGAEVAVQELVNTLHACAHAGLSVLELVALTDRGEGVQDMAGLVANSLAIAPGLEDLLLEIAPAVARAAAELGVEEKGLTPRLSIFVSGGGRSLENLAERIRAHELDVELALVVSNAPQAFALERAKRLGIPSLVVDAERKLTPDEFSREAFTAAEVARAELVVLAGFLRLLVIPASWIGRVLNIHPALLPAFGGKGFYGDKVHAAVLASGASESGCTVHYVTNEYDKGPILLQRKVPVLPGDDVHTLATRVFEAEKLALPEAIAAHFAR